MNTDFIIVPVKVTNCSKCPLCEIIYERDDDGDDYNLKCKKLDRFVSTFLNANELENYNKIDNDCPFKSFLTLI